MKNQQFNETKQCLAQLMQGLEGVQHQGYGNTVNYIPDMFYYHEAYFEFEVDFESEIITMNTELVGDDEDGCEIHSDMSLEINLIDESVSVDCDPWSQEEEHLQEALQGIEMELINSKSLFDAAKKEYAAMKPENSINILLTNK